MGSPPPDPGAPGRAQRGALLADRYRLDRPIATGGMARVWKARDEVLGRPVAVKVLLDHLTADDSFVARFRAEALAAARLAHPSVVSVYDTCSGDGIEAIVMELVDGETLRHRMDRDGPLPPADAARIGARIADALAVAHRAGIVHRDIKPANVLLATSGRVVVTDFGIAKASESGDLTTDQQMLGTAKYLAPEQVEGRSVDGRSDVYALGVVLYEMVCGRVPFAADTEAATALARLHRDPEPPRTHRPDLPEDFERVVLRALARRPDDRWPDAPSLVRSLTALATGRPLPPDPPAPRPSSDDPGDDVATTALPGRAAPVAAARTGPPAEGSSRHEWRSPDAAPATAGPAPARPAFSPRPAEAAPPPATPAPPAPRPPRPRRRRGPTLALVAVLAVSLLIIAVLGWRIVGSGGTETLTPAASAFDPFGTGAQGEHDSEVPRAVDGDPGTAWTTETYSAPDLAAPGQKGGVGLLLDLGSERTTETLVVRSPTSGWTARAYVFDDPPGGGIDTWGAAADEQEGIDGDVRLDLGGAGGRIVLLWITRTSDAGRVDVSEATVEVRS